MKLRKKVYERAGVIYVRFAGGHYVPAGWDGGQDGTIFTPGDRVVVRPAPDIPSADDWVQVDCRGRTEFWVRAVIPRV